jgi:hypothetical protein
MYECNTFSTTVVIPNYIYLQLDRGIERVVTCVTASHNTRDGVPVRLSESSLTTPDPYSNDIVVQCLHLMLDVTVLVSMKVSYIYIQYITVSRIKSEGSWGKSYSGSFHVV